MSNLSIRSSALAIAVALALPGAAFAATTSYGSAAPVYASNVLSPTSVVTVVPDATYTLAAADNLWGRTVGFGVRIELTGATFSSTPVLAMSSNWVPTAPATGVTVASTTNSPTVATYSIPAPTTAINVADVLKLGGFNLTGITGSTVTAKVTLFDPTTTADLPGLSATYTVLTSQQAVTLALSTAGADVDKKIDVFAGANVTAKTGFSKTGEVGWADAHSSDPNAQDFHSADLTLGLNSVLGTDGVSLFQYLPAADKYTIVVTASQALTGLSDYQLIVGGTTYTGVPGTGANANKVTFSNVAPDSATGGTYQLHFLTDYAHGGILPQTFTATAAVEFANPSYIDFAATAFPAVPLPLAYNGSVIQLFNVNPASNPTSESFLRYTNTTTAPYKVTLTGIDDAGLAASGTFDFTLGAGQSITLTSKDFEQGSSKGNGAFGAPSAGKWIVTATAEGSGLVASGLNRNASGTISTLNDEKHTDPSDGTTVKAQ